MKSLLRNSSWLLLTAWLATACTNTEHTVYHDYQSIPARGWGKSDTLLFHIPVTDSLKRLQLWVEVRNESWYQYQNLYLVVGHNLQDSTCFQTDTVNLYLADKEGKWKGSGLGSMFQSSLSIGTAMVLHPGNYTFRISHGMKDNLLPGINDVGVKIDK